MKKIISAACLLGLSMAGNLLNIKVGDRVTINNQSTYNLSCEGATGAVKFYVEGTPSGVSLSGSSIIISNFAQSGNYSLRIKAVDEIGQSAERQITLSIIQNNGQATLVGQTVTGSGSFSSSSTQSVNQSVTGTQTIVGVQFVQTGGVTGQVTGQTGSQPTGTGSQPVGSGSQPNGGTSSSPSTGNNDRLNGLISNYSTTVPTTPNYGTSGRYPEANLPTAPSSNLVNPTPITIATSQTTPTQSNRNTITPDDVTLRAASERHQNAIKGITNLLSIIDQANANRNKAQNDIQTYTQAYNDAVNSQRTAQNDIITI